jgi:ketosteroid isomerase-like protein
MPSAEAELDEANRRFYEALESLDLDLMDRVWSHTDPVRCIHPGWDVLEGWAAIRRSFAQIFAGTSWLRVTPTSVLLADYGSVGLVVCSENITTKEGSGVGVAVAQATNLFTREAGLWKLLLHHASLSPAPPSAPFLGGGAAA